MQKNDIVPLRIERMSGAQGVAHADGRVVFVRNALEGETVRARIEKIQPNCAFAKALEIEDPSPHRVTPHCPYYAVCGGCTLQHMDYALQLAVKQQTVADALRRIGGVDMEVQPVLGMRDPWHYRNKAALPVAGAPGSPQIGYYAPRSHRVTDMDRCLIAREETNAVLAAVRQWMERYAVEPYDESTGKGLVRHLLCRVNRTGQSLLCVVASSLTLPREQELVEVLRKQVPGIASVTVCRNQRRDNVILGDTLRTLWGADALRDTLCELTFTVSPLSFFQVNPEQTETLYRTALAFADPGPGDRVADLYCGAGTISLMLAQRAGEVLGIEYVPQAVENARANSVENGIRNCRFIAGAAEELLPDLCSRGYRPDIVVLDPPRKGADRPVLDAILQAQPRRIVYVSCDPATLARDVRILTAGGYTAELCQPVDMFCQTEHVETVVQMSRQ